MNNRFEGKTLKDLSDPALGIFLEDPMGMTLKEFMQYVTHQLMYEAPQLNHKEIEYIEELTF